MKAPVLDESARFVGRVLRDKWRIDAKIARGGVAMVYEATHKNNGHRVAIKLLHPEFSRDEDARGRFLQEGYAANKVGHPGVARIIDDDVTEEGYAFLVMELLEGELLERRRARKGGRLALGEVLSVGDQLLDVLAAAHAKGIVHRDIKPDNLFLLRDGTLKVLDFGFAQMRDGFRTEQTATGFLLGTPGFMSPEQALGSRGRIDAQTDIWAAGATLFLCLSGRPVHETESVAEALVAAANFQPRSLGTLEPTLAPALIAVVDRALAFEKEHRFASARDMQQALREAAVAHPLLESSTRPVASDAEFDAERTISEDNILLGEQDLEEVSAQSSLLDRPADSDDVPTIATTSPAVRRALMESVVGDDKVPSSHNTVILPGGSGAYTAPRPAAGAPAPRPAAGTAPPPAQPVTSQSTEAPLPFPPAQQSYRPSMPSGAGAPHATGQSPALSPLAVGGGGLINTPPQPFSLPPQDVRASSPQVPPSLDSGRVVHSSHLPTHKIQPMQPKSGNRLIVLVGISVLSMAIVLVAGLLVLAASD